MSNDDFHALIRTSKYGEKFVGKCIKCGIENLTMKDVHAECVNPAGLDILETLELVNRLTCRQ